MSRCFTMSKVVTSSFTIRRQLMFIFIISELCSFIFSIPAAHFKQLPSAELEFEQCVYQANSANKLLKTVYGQCQSMNGPDGCCLEGHYKPGICSNLAHICCTKPDPDCSQMRHNKGITITMIKQRREYFKKFAHDNKERSTQSEHPATARPSSLRLSSHNSPMRINFEIVEMPAHMQLDAVTFISEALNQKKDDFDEAANYLCRMLDQKYPEKAGTNWGCIVGNRFDYSIEASPGKYMLFYIGSIQVMAFVPKSSEDIR